MKYIKRCLLVKVVILLLAISLCATMSFAQTTIAIAGGDAHTIVLKDDGTVWTWGLNNYGQLGNGTTNESSTPVQVIGPGGIGFLTGIKAIAGGSYHTIALKDDGTVWTWGANANGRLGLGTDDFSPHPTPAQVVDPNDPTGFLTGVLAVAGGSAHTVALKEDGTVWDWGHEGFSNYGPVPTQIVKGTGGILSGITAIAASFDQTMALQNDGTVWAWGGNFYAQTGAFPLPVATGVSAIAAGAFHLIVLKEDGTVWTWGLNNLGQLGNGGTDFYIHSVPSKVWSPNDPTGFLTGVVAIAGGDHHSIAIKNDGTVWGWGYNGDGVLGNGSTWISTTPVQVAGPGGNGFLTGIEDIAVGYNHTISLKNDATVWTWGSNFAGQLGNGTATFTPVLTPVQVTNTTTGASVDVSLTDVELVFDNITKSGGTTANILTTPPASATSFFTPVPNAVYYEFSTTATYTNQIHITITYDPTGLTIPESDLRLYKTSNLGVTWIDVTDTTISPNPDTVNHKITGVSNSFSIYAVGVPKGIKADVAIEPKVINLKDKGVYTATITLPTGYNVADIDSVSVAANGFLAKTTQASANKFIAKFNVDGLVDAGITITADTRQVIIDGYLKDGTFFRGEATVKVINPGKK